MTGANDVVTLTIQGDGKTYSVQTDRMVPWLNTGGFLYDLHRRINSVTGEITYEISRIADGAVSYFKSNGEDAIFDLDTVQPLGVVIYELAMKHLIKEKDVSKTTDAKFKPGDVVLHKTNEYRKFVVSYEDDGFVFCTYLHPDATNGKMDVQQIKFDPDEVEHYVEKKEVVSNVCERCPYACENGGFGDGDDAEDDDPFALDDDDFPADVGETDVTLMDLDELLQEAVDRLQEEGFDQLAATVAYAKYGYTIKKGVKNG